jgi:ribokinase
MVPEKPYVLIIGSSNMDLNIYSERLPNPGETVTGGKFKRYLGGKGANQAVASSRAGTSTIFIGNIGNDEFGNQMITQLSKEGINTEHIFKDSDESSGIAFILIDKNGENMISVAPGANNKLNIEKIQSKSKIIKNAKVLIVQMEIPIETIIEVFQIASEGECIKILNPAPLKPIPLEMLKLIDIIVPNYGELIRLNSLLALEDLPNNRQEKLLQASKNLSQYGLNTIITTLGSDGIFLYQAIDEISTLLPAYKVNAIDTVGAGDCFNGVLASKIAQGKGIIESIKYAICAASIAVTRKGAQESMPYEPEIIKRFIEYNNFLDGAI